MSGMTENSQTVRLAVNGTLMRGLELEGNLLEVGARFLYEARTEKCYRLWSIRDVHPAMIRVSPGTEPSTQVDVEVWEVPAAGLASVLLKEPEGLTVGKVTLEDGLSWALWANPPWSRACGRSRPTAAGAVT